MHRLWIAAGALTGLKAVGWSAWAAHAGPRVLAPAELAMLGTALQTMGWHAPALIAAALWAERRGRLAHAGCGLLLAGLILFAGALFCRALWGVSLGFVAPLGGLTLMAGWAVLAASAVRR
ncbi:MAG: DUF423 domain-containing protein [Acetobacteraceae bacterium]|nr:DUF423 domain-containing protein [Acetobacteraceae bacterium]